MNALERRFPWLVVVLVIAIAAVIPAESSPAAAGEPAGSNLALGKKCAFSPRPNYSHCTDAGDADQLTDGKTTKDYFWTQQGTVGWSAFRWPRSASPRTRRADRGRHAANRGGQGRRHLANGVYVLVSDDGKPIAGRATWWPCTKPPTGRCPATTRSSDWKEATFARAAAMCSWSWCRCRAGVIYSPTRSKSFEDRTTCLPPRPRDRWYAARARFSNRPASNGASRAVSLATSGRSALPSTRPLERGGPPRLASEVETLAQTAPLTILRRRDLFARCCRSARTTPGCSSPRRSSGGAWGCRSRRRGGRSLGPADPFAVPAAGGPPLRVELMRGEYRGGPSIWPCDRAAIEVRLRFSGFPGGTAPGWITVHQAEWTDTSQLVPVVSALPVAKRDGRGWVVNVHPGLVRQVWLTIHPDDVAPGEHAGRIEIEGEGLPPQSIPLAIRVWPMRFPQQTTLWLGGFSYTDNRAQRGVTAENHEAFVAHLRERFVNAPWGSAAVLRDFEFVDGRPDRVRLNTERFDRWVAEWPGARAYLVFLSVAHYSGAIETSLGGAALGSEEFDQRVGTWIRSWVEHLRSKGIAPNRLGLLIHDEPHEGSDITALLAWARAIRKAAPEVLIWEDPTYRQPQNAPPELFEACDILCPNRPMWLEHAAAFEPFYRKQQEAGRTLQFYSCSGPAKLLDPYSYHRLQAWQAWQAGANGSFFWAFGDTAARRRGTSTSPRRGPIRPCFWTQPRSPPASRWKRSARA